MWTPDLMAREIGRRIIEHLGCFSMEKRFRLREVDKEKVYRSMQPTPKALEYFRQKGYLGSILVAKKTLRVFESEFAQKHQIPILQIPIHMRPPTEEEDEELMEFLKNPANHPVLVHCAHGKDRTGYIICRYRIEVMGWSCEKAWKEMVRFGHVAFPWDIARHAHLRKHLEKMYNTTLTV